MLTTPDAAHGAVRMPPDEAPYYVPIGNEVELYERCHARGLPVLLKGPTGCGKTRFVEHMAWKLGRPLVTVACHDDLSASDLTGRWLIRGVAVDAVVRARPSGRSSAGPAGRFFPLRYAQGSE